MPGGPYLKELVRYMRRTSGNWIPTPGAATGYLMNKAEQSWQDTGYVLGLFSGQIRQARKGYREFVEKGIPLGQRPELVEGFIYQMKQFQHERFSALPICYIGAEEMIRETVEYIRKRVVFGKPLIQKQVLRHRLVEWLSEIEALRQLTYHIVRLKMAGQDATREISMGKLLGGRLLNKVADGCLQMHGGMGFMNEMRVSRFFRDTRLIAIGAGASEVMSDVIAKLEGF